MIPAPPGADLAAVVALAALATGYGAYWFSATSPGLETWWARRAGPERAMLLHVFTQRTSGVVFLGVLPLAALLCLPGARSESLGLAGGPVASIALWTAGMVVVAAPLSFLLSRTRSYRITYPSIPVGRDWRVVALNVASWAAYLLAYELLFRGLVLMSCVRALGILPAVAINLCLYFLAHLPYGPRVCFGTLPVGIALCLATVETGTIWPAFVAHLALTSPHRRYVTPRTEPPGRRGAVRSAPSRGAC